MMRGTSKNQIYIGTGLAVLATLVWSGNFIIARAVHKTIPPVSLAFYRWATASLLLLPFAYKKFIAELPTMRKHISYLFWVALSGVALFNSFVYIAGHYSPAINLALIGTTSSPIMAIILARIFLKEKITTLRVLGLLVCIAGIVVLLTKGDWNNLLHFQFSKGDYWILLAAFCFAVYSTLVRKKPNSISPGNFLFTIFSGGTILLFPFYLWEQTRSEPVEWNALNIGSILYLGLGTSFIAYLCWNAAIARLGAARTALFGNLIPVFSTLEAVVLLHESVGIIHFISFFLVIAGLAIANLNPNSIRQ
jgi:drug/metabolite transporter (DMT)-like permease